MKQVTRQRQNTQRGNASVEFALSFALLWSVVSGVYQLGHSLYVYNQLSVAMSTAARFAGRDSIGSVKDGYSNRIKNVAVYGNPEGTGEPMVKGLATSNIDVDIQEDGEGVPRNVTVGVNQFKVDGVFWSTNLVDKPYSTVRYSGRWQPFV
ncbi:MAG: pilus assembly protein [Acidobacteria bacterium]|nr:pilus assembly protein [Acidobacteriota bacterium]